ncbi:hypothetical protein QE152_g40499, partial [Popillia japonica]
VVAVVVTGATVGIVIGIVYAAGGLTSADLHCTNVGDPQNGRVVASADVVTIVWFNSIVAEHCNITYEGSIYLDEAWQANFTTDLTFYVYRAPNIIPVCTTITVHMTAYSNAGYSSNTIKMEHDTSTPLIDEVNVNDEVISWTLTDNRPGCTFEIQIDGQPLNELTPERMFETSILDHCQQYQITITPIHSNQGRGTGYTLPFQHDINATSVKQFSVDDPDGIVTATWYKEHPKCMVVINVNERDTYITAPTGLRVLDTTDFPVCSTETHSISAQYYWPDLDKTGPLELIDFQKRLLPYKGMDVIVNVNREITAKLRTIDAFDECVEKVGGFQMFTMGSDCFAGTFYDLTSTTAATTTSMETTIPESTESSTETIYTTTDTTSSTETTSDATTTESTETSSISTETSSETTPTETTESSSISTETSSETTPTETTESSSISTETSSETTPTETTESSSISTETSSETTPTETTESSSISTDTSSISTETSSETTPTETTESSSISTDTSSISTETSSETTPTETTESSSISTDTSSISTETSSETTPTETTESSSISTDTSSISTETSSETTPTETTESSSISTDTSSISTETSSETTPTETTESSSISTDTSSETTPTETTESSSISTDTSSISTETSSETTPTETTESSSISTDTSSISTETSSETHNENGSEGVNESQDNGLFRKFKILPRQENDFTNVDFTCQDNGLFRKFKILPRQENDFTNVDFTCDLENDTEVFEMTVSPSFKDSVGIGIVPVTCLYTVNFEDDSEPILQLIEDSSSRICPQYNT